MVFYCVIYQIRRMISNSFDVELLFLLAIKKTNKKRMWVYKINEKKKSMTNFTISASNFYLMKIVLLIIFVWLKNSLRKYMNSYHQNYWKWQLTGESKLEQRKGLQFVKGRSIQTISSVYFKLCRNICFTCIGVYFVYHS